MTFTLMGCKLLQEYLYIFLVRSLVILNDVQLQSTHCTLLPLMVGRGILVDHWSTISSFAYYVNESPGSHFTNHFPITIHKSFIIFSSKS